MSFKFSSKDQEFQRQYMELVQQNMKPYAGMVCWYGTEDILGVALGLDIHLPLSAIPEVADIVNRNINRTTGLTPDHIRSAIIAWDEANKPLKTEPQTPAPEDGTK